jgi:transcriptional regulator with XRE-family HTH domain
MTIGDRIKAERDARGWSQQKLAKRAGVSQQLITRLETGKVNETKRIVQLAKAFGITAEELQAEPPPPTAMPTEQLVHRVCDFMRRELDEPECNKCAREFERSSSMTEATKATIDYTLQVHLADETGRICITSPEVPGLLIWAKPKEAFADVLGSIKKLRDLNLGADIQG